MWNRAGASVRPQCVRDFGHEGSSPVGSGGVRKTTVEQLEGQVHLGNILDATHRSKEATQKN